jgi:hypothetical protein
MSRKFRMENAELERRRWKMGKRMEDGRRGMRGMKGLRGIEDRER